MMEGISEKDLIQSGWTFQGTIEANSEEEAIAIWRSINKCDPFEPVVAIKREDLNNEAD